jgi:filamentous hemagglutinin family protein
MRFLKTARCGRGLLVLGMALSSASVAAGSVVTDGTLGIAQPIAGPNYAITQAFGQIVGSNLFHSFGTFNIGTGESATFSSVTPVSNVIARVTGSASSIDGLIASTISGANLFFINPRGISFGPNAALNVSGSFYASTADYLKLGTTGRFDAKTPGNSVLTAAPPSAFGFVGPSPAAISVSGSGLLVPTGQTLSLVGGDISATNSAVLAAFAGHINLASVASGGEVTLNPTGITTSGVNQYGTIELNHSFVAVDSGSGLPAGSVAIRGGRLVMDSGSFIRSINGVAAPGGGIEATLSGAVSLDHSSVIFTKAQGSGSAGNVNVQAGSLSLANGSEIYSFTSASGQGGSVAIAATGQTSISGADSFGNPSGVFTYTVGPGDAGSINLQLGALSLTDGGEIVAETFGAGRSGSVAINANGSVAISSAGSAGPSVVSVYSAAAGSVGSISVTAPDLSIGTGGQIAAETDGSGRTGDINLQLGSLSLSNGGQVSTTAFGAGQGGAVTIIATSPISMSGADSSGKPSGVVTLAASTGNAGSIGINAPSLNLSSLARIQSATSGHGSAGAISVTVPSLSVDGGGRIASVTAGPGDAGNINVQAGALSLTNGGLITANTFGAGQGGSIIVTATDSVVISGANSSNFSGIFVSSKNPATGSAGSISVTAPSLSIDAAGIQSVTETPGNAGGVNLQVGTLSLTNGSQIDVSTFGAGHGGSVTITANGPITISGIDSSGSPSGVLASSFNPATGDAGRISVTAASLSIDGQGFIQSKTEGPGNAGNVDLHVDALSITNGGLISASTFGAGRGGSVTVNTTGPINISGVDSSGNPSGIFVNSKLPATGNAGSISVTAPSLNLDGGRVQTGTEGSGNAGDVNLQVGALSLVNGGQIAANTIGAGKGGSVAIAVTGAISVSGSDGSGHPSGLFASSDGSGAGGAISVSAGDILLNNGGAISAKSHGTGNAGTLTLNAANSLQLLNGAQITTEATHADGGNIEIHAGTLVYLLDSKITTSVGTGQGNGGNIFIDPTFVVLQGSQITANAFGGNGGNITIIADHIFKSLDSSITASSQLGISGTVTLTAPIVDISGSLVTLPTPYLNAGNLLAERCAAQLAGKASSFVVAGRGGMPVEPDGLLPGVTLMGSSSAVAHAVGEASTVQLALSGFDFGCSK